MEHYLNTMYILTEYSKQPLEAGTAITPFHS